MDGVQVKHPIPCYGRTSIAAVPGMRTLEECVRLLLEEGEQIVGDLDQPTIAIQRAGTVVGYLEITTPPDPMDPTLTPDDYRELSMGELHATLRIACHTLAMLDNLDSCFESSDEECARIIAMSETEQAELRLRSRAVAEAVRHELRRRAEET
jgi:hypothetical protein